ncbi:MAG TPA: hypothetical protein VFD70_02375 [Anaerolineae bacterium]|nr:hypothetical protein [Anaerolineae bacterium]
MRARWGVRPPMEYCHVIQANGTWHNAESVILKPPRPVVIRSLAFTETVCAVHYQQGNANRIQRVRLAWTPTQFGGHRRWFVCQCGRRAFQLYWTPYYYEHPDKFLCRACHEITYLIRNSDYRGTSYAERAERFARAHFLDAGDMWLKKPHAPVASFERAWAAYERLMQRAEEELRYEGLL